MPDIEGLQSPAAHYRKAFDLAPKELDAYYIQQILKSHADANELQKALDFANTVEEKRGDDEKVAQIISSVRENIFGKNPQARIAHLEEQAEANPDSTQLLTELFNAYNKQGNVSKASELSKRLMKMNPPAETVQKIAQMRLEDGRPKAALKAYERAQKQGAQLKAGDYFNRGTAYQKMGQLSKAREQYRKAAEMKENFGRAYIAIGDLYARAVNNCSGSEMSRSDKAVYWAAVDKYRQAKEIDPSVTSTANSKIKTYRRVFPTTEDIFYRDAWEKGGSFTINYGCYSWIGETTTVRPAPSSG
jgi:tetratricopeptide (TPR) repeat protein